MDTSLQCCTDMQKKVNARLREYRLLSPGSGLRVQATKRQPFLAYLCVISFSIGDC